MPPSENESHIKELAWDCINEHTYDCEKKFMTKSDFYKAALRSIVILSGIVVSLSATVLTCTITQAEDISSMKSSQNNLDKRVERLENDTEYNRKLLTKIYDAVNKNK